MSALAGVLLFSFVPQARDLFADISFGALPRSLDAWRHWLLFFLYLVLIWAFPVHYAARRMLETKDWIFPRRVRDTCDAADLAKRTTEIKGELVFWTDAIPRVLGFIPFLAVLIGLWKAHGVVAKTQALGPASDTGTQIFVLAVIDLIVAGLFTIFLVKRRGMITKLRQTWSNRAPTFIRVAIPTDFFEVIAIVSFVVVTAISAISYLYPFLPADIAPRAVIVPFLFGGLVFLATLLAWASDRTGFPVLTLSIVAAFAVTALNSHFNDLRLIMGTPRNLPARQIDIDVAIDKWKAANHCADDRCPPALIVAAEGGASRAAFAAATAIGQLLDRSNELPDKSAIAPARRIFAISGVSGGSFGAVTIRTALWEALERGEATPPCKRAPSSWFAATTRDVTKSWRACLQALVAGDFLTPAFVGLGFRDNLSPPKYLFLGPTLLSDDRAALVEKAWERHFDQVISGQIPTPFWQAMDDLRASGPEPEAGLRRRFGYVAEKLKGGAWLPLLVLNGTSVNTGTRILVSDIVSTRTAPAYDNHPPGRESLYPAAFDLFEMLSTPCAKVEREACAAAHDGVLDEPKKRDGADVRLSTAAMLSARFPIVSPAGTIRAKGKYDKEGDQVVDGGYFENAGLTTALDVARALRTRHITPIVLWVQNDPTSGEGDPEERNTSPTFPPRAAGTPRLGTAEPKGLEALFGVIATPFLALTNTRTGHSMEEASYAQRILEETNTKAPESDRGINYFTFQMFRYPQFGAAAGSSVLSKECAVLARAVSASTNRLEMSEVSMSWWLSQAVQSELDSQICDERNRKSLDDLMKRLSQSLSVDKQ